MFRVKISLGKIGETKFHSSSGILRLHKILMCVTRAKERYGMPVFQMNFFKEPYFEQWTCLCLLELVFDRI